MITLIAAVSSNGVMGDSTTNKMPWHCSEELKFFKAQTMGKILVMGRTTAESVGKLPGRDSIVLSRNTNYTLAGFESKTMDNFIHKYSMNRNEDYMICGGAEIYKLFIPIADKAIISTFKFSADGDVYLPTMDILGGQQAILEEETDYEQFTVRTWVPTNLSTPI
tara:strand:- start:1341 stop:1835 length:495 start_codon:yes stop_codon:yes gene_type:complete